MLEHVEIRRATVDDAPGVAAVMNAVIAEGRLTLFDAPFSDAEERAFIASLGERSALHVALQHGRVCGVQSVDLFAPDASAASMRHVATMGTWIAHHARGQGVGRRLAAESFQFALRGQFHDEVYLERLLESVSHDRASI